LDIFDLLLDGEAFVGQVGLYDLVSLGLEGIGLGGAVFVLGLLGGFNVLHNLGVDLRHNGLHERVSHMGSDGVGERLLECGRKRGEVRVVLVEPVLQPLDLLLVRVHDLDGRVVKSSGHFMDLPFQSIRDYFKLHYLVLFGLGFLLEGLNLPLDDVFDFEIESHPIVVDRVQDDRVGHSHRPVARLTHLNFELLYRFLHVVLDDLHSLDDHVFEDALPLLEVGCVGGGLLLKFRVQVSLQLVVHAELLVEHLIHSAGTAA